MNFRRPKKCYTFDDFNVANASVNAQGIFRDDHVFTVAWKRKPCYASVYAWKVSFIILSRLVNFDAIDKPGETESSEALSPTSSNKLQ